MGNEWIVIEIETRGEFVDLLGAVLAESGSLGTIVDERSLDTFQVPDEPLEAGASYTLRAFFQASATDAMLVDELAARAGTIPVLARQKLKFCHGGTVKQENWAENWKQNFAPLHIGRRLLIRPTWEQDQPENDLIVVEIDPGMAFGTGSHGTTRLCLELIENFMVGSDPPRRMLDVGTGSGILALAAAALGCPEVIAADIDEQACVVAGENVTKNNLDHSIRITNTPLELLPGCYDLVVANILAEENIRLRHAFIDHLEVGGHLILSGILREKEDLVRQGFALSQLNYLSTSYADEWVCLLFRRLH